MKFLVYFYVFLIVHIIFSISILCNLGNDFFEKIIITIIIIIIINEVVIWLNKIFVVLIVIIIINNNNIQLCIQCALPVATIMALWQLLIIIGVGGTPQS